MSFGVLLDSNIQYNNKLVHRRVINLRLLVKSNIVSRERRSGCNSREVVVRDEEQLQENRSSYKRREK